VRAEAIAMCALLPSKKVVGVLLEELELFSRASQATEGRGYD